MVVVSDLNKDNGGSTDLAKKMHGSADLHTPIHPPPKHFNTSIKDKVFFERGEKKSREENI